MTQEDRIKVSVEYPSLWLGMEISLSPGEDAIAAFIRTKATVDAAYRKITGGEAIQSNSQLPETQVTKVPEDLRIANMIADINSCQDVKVLETYRLLVKGNPTFQEEYDKKFAELSGK